MPLFSPSEGVQIHYEVSGANKPPLLLIHGFMGTGRSEFASLIPHLARQYQLILPDLRGYGESSPKPRAYSPDFYREDAEDLVALLAHLSLRGVRVLGYSDGGEVALWLALLAAERIRGVVTWGATGFFSPVIKPAILSMLNFTWHTPEMAALHGGEYLPLMTQRWVQAMTQIIDRGGDVTLTRAGEITCPVLLLLGDRDPLNPLENGQKMAEALPQGRLIAFHRTGHAIHQERTWWFRWHISRFLSRL